MQNSHLVYPVIIDLIEKMQSSKTQNEKLALLSRLEATRDAIEEAVQKVSRKPVFKSKAKK